MSCRDAIILPDEALLNTYFCMPHGVFVGWHSVELLLITPAGRRAVYQVLPPR